MTGVKLRMSFRVERLQTLDPRRKMESSSEQARSFAFTP